MRRVDIDEESYFNGDDEDDDEGVAPGPHPAPNTLLPTLISPPLSRFQSLPRRKRQHPPSIPLRTGLGTHRAPVPAPTTPIHLPRTPPISALVEYGDDDEQSSDPEDALLESLVSARTAPPSGAGTISTPPTITTTTTTTTTATTPTPSAVTNTTTTTVVPTTAAGTGPGVGGGGFVPLRSEKRRRVEEDEDEMGLERLIGGKSKRPAKTGATGAGEEGPKRIRLRFGAASLAAASSTLPTAARSESGAKDGDTG